MVLYTVLYGTLQMKYPLIKCDLKDSVLNLVYEH